MTFGASALSAIVAAASVTQLVQFGGKVFWDKDILQAGGTITVEGPLAGAATAGVRFCLEEHSRPTCPPRIDCPIVVESSGFLADDWEAATVFGSSAGAFLLGGLASLCQCRAGVQKRAREEEVPQQQYGRGALLRDARIGHRQRLQALGPGQLGSAAV